MTPPPDLAPRKRLLRDVTAVVMIVVGNVCLTTAAAWASPAVGVMVASAQMIAAGILLGTDRTE